MHTINKDMKRIARIAIVASAAVLAATSVRADVIYTGELGKNVIGYNGPTPVSITVENGKIVSIEAEANKENPGYQRRAEAKVFPQYVGLTVQQALELKADAATGATYTSKALIENIRLGLQQASKTTAKASKKSTKVSKNKKKNKKKSSRRSKSSRHSNS